ncbi:hypothetical protein FJT64_008211 [Amphibalanus amphitrite]|uniref:Uncharacterized protein n=1 Tax=Amphibalanus amphitrite TaxID=1232801 RepID=A0A6A4VXD3_AMPAM|nr:hypothetical protein FJT64_008211 [Amphibalanus amphitrite]
MQLSEALVVLGRVPFEFCRPEPSAAERAASRVRVTYFESKKPLTVPAVEAGDTSTPEESDVSAPDALPQASPDVPAHTQVTASTGEMPTTYIVQTLIQTAFRKGAEVVSPGIVSVHHS